MDIIFKREVETESWMWYYNLPLPIIVVVYTISTDRIQIRIIDDDHLTFKICIVLTSTWSQINLIDKCFFFYILFNGYIYLGKTANNWRNDLVLSSATSFCLPMRQYGWHGGLICNKSTSIWLNSLSVMAWKRHSNLRCFFFNEITH